MASEMCGFAAAAMDRGWSVFPVLRNKSPATEHGFHDATRDFDRIEDWWARNPGLGIAVATGLPSGIWVLDLDGPQASEVLSELEALHGKIDLTVKAKTGRGFHLYFKMPRAGDLRNSAGAVGKGIDVRGTGGYAVMPPTLHPSGRLYDWVAGQGPEDLPLADAPEWMVKLAQRSPPTPEPLRERVPIPIRISARYLEVAIEQECGKLASARPGTRNDTLNRACFALARFVEEGFATADRVILPLAGAAAQSGLPMHETARTIRSAFASRGLAP